MPEIPDLTLYQNAMKTRLLGESILGIRIASPFVLRTAVPVPETLFGSTVQDIRRIGKRLVLEVDDSRFIVIHLMIAGRLKWQAAAKKLNPKIGLLAIDFRPGTLMLTEASQKHRASVHLIEGEAKLAEFDSGGIDVFSASEAAFVAALSRENHTLKRALTDQRFLSGIGNAYSDEILHRARISPMRQTRYLDESQWQALYQATQSVLAEWIERLADRAGDKFPDKVSAFQPEMAVHGKFRQPCPDCGHPVQRIRYATNECNYCAACQNQGKLLADRSLSRLLKKDWPRKLEDLENP